MLPLPPNSATNRPPGFSTCATPAITSSASGIQCSTALENTASNPSQPTSGASSTRSALSILPAPSTLLAVPAQLRAATCPNLTRNSLASTTSNCSAGNFLFAWVIRSEEHTSELQSRGHLVCRLLLEKKKKNINSDNITFS